MNLAFIWYQVPDTRYQTLPLYAGFHFLKWSYCVALSQEPGTRDLAICNQDFILERFCLCVIRLQATCTSFINRTRDFISENDVLVLNGCKYQAHKSQTEKRAVHQISIYSGSLSPKWSSCISWYQIPDTRHQTPQAHAGFHFLKWSSSLFGTRYPIPGTRLHKRTQHFIF